MPIGAKIICMLLGLFVLWGFSAIPILSFWEDKKQDELGRNAFAIVIPRYIKINLIVSLVCLLTMEFRVIPFSSLVLLFMYSIMIKREYKNQKKYSKISL